MMFPGEMFITIRTPHIFLHNLCIPVLIIGYVYDYCKSLKLLNDLFVFGRDKT